jgi:hypothetical protein
MANDETFMLTVSRCPQDAAEFRFAAAHDYLHGQFTQKRRQRLSGLFRIVLQAPQEPDLTGVIKVVGSGATDQVKCWGRRGYEGRDYCPQTAVFGWSAVQPGNAPPGPRRRGPGRAGRCRRLRDCFRRGRVALDDPAGFNPVAKQS